MPLFPLFRIRTSDKAQLRALNQKAPQKGDLRKASEIPRGFPRYSRDTHAVLPRSPQKITKNSSKKPKVCHFDIHLEKTFTNKISGPKTAYSEKINPRKDCLNLLLNRFLCFTFGTTKGKKTIKEGIYLIAIKKLRRFKK